LIINFYAMRLGNVSERASIKLYNASGTSFIKLYIEMTMSVRFVLSSDF